MHSVRFDLETITPLFMSGTDHTEHELRPPSFKGLMRFWWRAMRAEDNIKKLAQDEADIFGGTGKGQGKSKLQIKFTNTGEIKFNKDFLAEVGFSKKDKEINAGLVYLLYSTILKNKRAYITPGQKFSIVLRGMDKEIMYQGLASLWLALYLGGFGTRSRRGGGNIAVNEIQQSGFDELNPRFVPTENLLNAFLKDGFNWAKEIIKTEKPSTEYSNLVKPRIITGPQYNNWKEALNEIGGIYRKYRTNIKANLFKGPNFGIPVMHSGFKTRLVAYKDNELLSDRRSSPLIIKIIRFKEKYVPIAIRLSGNLLPENSKIMKEDKANNQWNPSGKPQNEDQHIIDNFLDTLKNNEKYTEISL